jgi:hypothetical protein
MNMIRVNQIRHTRILKHGFQIHFDHNEKYNEIVPTIISWIAANCGPYTPAMFQFRIYSNKICAYFSDPEHAMRFKLVWIA